MMRLAMVLTATAGLALAAGPPATAAQPEVAAGSGSTLGGALAFTVAAHDAGNGPGGHASVDFAGLGANAPFTLSGPVTCLTVTGSNATVGIRVDKATGAAAPFVGNGFFISLADGGKNDLYANSGFTNAVQEGDCTLAQAAVIPLERGNVVVRDDG